MTGLLDYRVALGFQQELWRNRRDGMSHDILLILQHHPTITLGRGGDRTNLLLDNGELRSKGIRFYVTDRGGDITYHGPGQLIGYPIVDLKDHNISCRDFINLLEEVIILTLCGLGIEAKRVPNLVGVWVGEKKVASIGVRIRKRITTHGFALNVNNDLGPFHYIYPCGIRGLGVTSLKEISGGEIDYVSLVDSITENFASVFNMKINEVSKI
ncbi:MAG: lipoyl(octanoyl) transferase LipB [Thermodesulfobacteriota bacterium]|nr:lipoyl(octanoyl) transferase LipB [Thermodesulfobacteriota bacterium]